MSRRIATVVRIRELQERLARAEVARRRAEAQTAAELERASWEALATRDEQLRTAFPPGAFVARGSMLAGGLNGALRAGDRRVDADHATQEAVADWTVAARNHDGVERLADRIADEQRVEHDRRAAVELDELVVQRHGGAR